MKTVGLVCFLVLGMLPLRAQTGNASAQTLTIGQAEQLALRNNPQIAVARLLALAEGQVTREARSAELPTLAGDLTAVEPHEGSRVTAGGLNNPVLYQRAAGGVTLRQMITDFGRTHNLVGSADLRAKAEMSAQIATADDITYAVDEAFYRTLTSLERAGAIERSGARIALKRCHSA